MIDDRTEVQVGESLACAATGTAASSTTYQRLASIYLARLLFTRVEEDVQDVRSLHIFVVEALSVSMKVELTYKETMRMVGSTSTTVWSSLYDLMGLTRFSKTVKW